MEGRGVRMATGRVCVCVCVCGALFSFQTAPGFFEQHMHSRLRRTLAHEQAQRHVRPDRGRAGGAKVARVNARVTRKGRGRATRRTIGMAGGTPPKKTPAHPGCAHATTRQDATPLDPAWPRSCTQHAGGGAGHAHMQGAGSFGACITLKTTKKRRPFVLETARRGAATPEGNQTHRVRLERVRDFQVTALHIDAHGGRALSGGHGDGAAGGRQRRRCSGVHQRRRAPAWPGRPGRPAGGRGMAGRPGPSSTQGSRSGQEH